MKYSLICVKHVKEFNQVSVIQRDHWTLDHWNSQQDRSLFKAPVFMQLCKTPSEHENFPITCTKTKSLDTRHSQTWDAPYGVTIVGM